jgi:hypothetical protein
VRVEAECFPPHHWTNLRAEAQELSGLFYGNKFVLLIEFGIPVKLVRLIKMCLTETYSRIWVGKNLSDMFPIRNGLKQGDALSPLFFNFALKYAIGRVQLNQDDFKLR